MDLSPVTGSARMVNPARIADEGGGVSQYALIATSKTSWPPSPSLLPSSGSSNESRPNKF